MMGVDVSCRKCSTDLENFNSTDCQGLFYCPHCGARVLKAQHEALLRKVTDGEMDDMIKEHLLDMLQWRNGGDISADELADLAWEAESCDGVVFYNDYQADRFTMRHGEWVDEALEYACSAYGDSDHYVKMKTECNDRFLVVAFVLATEHFLYDQLGIERDEGDLNKTRIAKIKRLVKTTSYDGKF